MEKLNILQDMLKAQNQPPKVRVEPFHRAKKEKSKAYLSEHGSLLPNKWALWPKNLDKD